MSTNASQIQSLKGSQEFVENKIDVTPLLEVPSLDHELVVLDAPLELYCDLKFMRAGNVRETWKIKNYEFDGHGIRSQFDREYFSALKNSPSHILPTTMGAVTQHMAFVYLSKYFGFDFMTEERVKVWPTHYEHNLGVMVSSEKDVVIEVQFSLLRSTKTPNQYYCEGIATVNGSLALAVKSIALVID